jgi:hypothetical protein
MKKEIVYQLIMGVLVLIILFLCLRLSKPNEVGRYQHITGLNGLGFLDTKKGIVCVPIKGNWIILDLKKIRPQNKQITTVIKNAGDSLLIP